MCVCLERLERFDYEHLDYERVELCEPLNVAISDSQTLDERIQKSQIFEF